MVVGAGTYWPRCYCCCGRSQSNCTFEPVVRLGQQSDASPSNGRRQGGLAFRHLPRRGLSSEGRGLTSIDWLVLRRIMGRLLLTVVIFLALFSLVESLNTAKLKTLSALGGPLLAVAGILLSALRSSIGALPVTV